MIVKTPGICSGDARIDGTRITVRTIVSCSSSGLTVPWIRELYPVLTDEQIQAALDYADAHPLEVAAQLHSEDHDADAEIWKLLRTLFKHPPSALTSITIQRSDRRGWSAHYASLAKSGAVDANVTKAETIEDVVHELVGKVVEATERNG